MHHAHDFNPLGQRNADTTALGECIVVITTQKLHGRREILDGRFDKAGCMFSWLLNWRIRRGIQRAEETPETCCDWGHVEQIGDVATRRPKKPTMDTIASTKITFHKVCPCEFIEGLCCLNLFCDSQSRDLILRLRQLCLYG